MNGKINTDTDLFLITMNFEYFILFSWLYFFYFNVDVSIKNEIVNLMNYFGYNLSKYKKFG